VSRIELICFDMAGTTMTDGGLVLEAFRRTIAELGLDGERAEQAEAFVVHTMGQSKIEVFTTLFHDDAPRANVAFEGHFVDAARELGVSEVPGARATIEALRSLGFKVALTTGFSVATREALIDVFGWSDLFDLRISPADAGRGRPAPDMLWWCALRLGVTSSSSLMAVGDTASDMVAGRRAGAGSCVGVLTGTDAQSRLYEHGADAVVDSVVDLLSFEFTAHR
jgi:phosphoglycolate phosphatase